MIKQLTSSTIRKQVDILIEAKKVYKPELDKVIELAKENKDDEATAKNSQNAKLGQDQRDAAQKLISMKFDEAKEKNNLNTEKVNAEMIIMLVVIVFSTRPVVR